MLKTKMSVDLVMTEECSNEAQGAQLHLGHRKESKIYRGKKKQGKPIIKQFNGERSLKS
jgi:hypothetical protein